PINLIGSLYKVIAKVLENRLVTALDDIVDGIQSAFVTDRQILDGPFILNEIVHWCKNKKKQSMIFKVDFKKAYDSVRWDFIDDIFRRFGFEDKWCKWIQSCLYLSRGSVLVNGSPTKEFQFHKGLKQGDSLSPFLFILVMESLHVSFQRVVDAGLFNGIKLDSSLQISHLFYTDDAIFMGQWNQCNIDTIIQVLDVFYRAPCLMINMKKNNLMGISVDSNKVLQNMESIRARFFNGADVNSKKPSWVRWKSVLVAKDVRVVKALHGEDGKIDKKVQSSYSSTWLNIINEIESLKLHEVASKLSHGGLEFSFRRNPRGGVEQAQFERLKEMVEGVILCNSNDRWSWSLVGTGDFSVSSVRKLIDNVILPRVFRRRDGSKRSLAGGIWSTGRSIPLKIGVNGSHPSGSR
nr:RNA-directed DNA polymerase, eukaryota [Tanacetum cinerariifolium]